MISKEVMAKLKKNVFVQLPEGLKAKATEVCKELESQGFECIISGDPCFGACDLRAIKGATTLHFGHSKMLDSANTVYVEYHMDAYPKKVKAKKLPERIGICTTVQHIHQLKDFKKSLEKQRKKVAIIPKGKRCTYKGQVLGCDFTGAEKISEKVDAFVFIGTGVFHAIGLAYYTNKQTFALDPFTGHVQEVNPDKWLKEKALRQTKAMNAKTYGIIVSTKPGQKDMRLAKKLKKRLGKNAIIILMDYISPDTLLPYKVDAFIVTACPRLVIDDWKNYSKPLLLSDEV